MQFRVAWFESRIGKPIRQFFWIDPRFGIKHFVITEIDGVFLWGYTTYDNNKQLYESWSLNDHWEDYDDV